MASGLKVADAIRRLIEVLGDFVEGVTSATGTTVTIKDTTRQEPDSYFNGGALVLISGTYAGVVAQVTGWIQSTGVMTFTPAVGGNVAASVQYIVSSFRYPKWLLFQKVNQVLRTAIATDITLTTVEDQEEYALPTGVHNVLMVEVATSTTTPYEYATHFNWREIGSKIRFDTGAAPDISGYIIRLTYYPFATTMDVQLYSDALPDGYDLDTVAWKAAVECLRWRMVQEGYQNPTLPNQINEAMGKAAQAEAINPIPTRDYTPHLGNW